MKVTDNDAPFDPEAAAAAVHEDDGEPLDLGLNGPMIGDEPDTEDAPPAKEDQGEQQAPEIPTFEIDGQAYTADQIKQGFLRHEDYTRKTMELSEQRKAQEVPLQLWEQLNNPATAAQTAQYLMAQLAPIAGTQPQAAPYGQPAPSPYGQTPQAPPVNWDDLSDEGRMLYVENQRLNQQLQAISPLLQQTQKFFAEQAERDQIAAESMKATQSLKERLGVVVSSEELREAVLMTGIKDPEAAWLKQNAPRIAQTMKVEGAKQAAKAPPPTPDFGRGRVISQAERRGMTLDELERALKRGAVFE